MFFNDELTSESDDESVELQQSIFSCDLESCNLESSHRDEPLTNEYTDVEYDYQQINRHMKQFSFSATHMFTWDNRDIEQLTNEYTDVEYDYQSRNRNVKQFTFSATHVFTRDTQLDDALSKPEPI